MRMSDHKSTAAISAVPNTPMVPRIAVTHFIRLPALDTSCRAVTRPPIAVVPDDDEDVEVADTLLARMRRRDRARPKPTMVTPTREICIISGAHANTNHRSGSD